MRVHRPVNDCYCSEWDEYYYLKASVLTSCASELHLTDLYIKVTGSISGPQGRFDFNLQMVINPENYFCPLERNYHACVVKIHFNPFLLISFVLALHNSPLYYMA